MKSMGSGWENLKIQLALKGLSESAILKNSTEYSQGITITL